MNKPIQTFEINNNQLTIYIDLDDTVDTDDDTVDDTVDTDDDIVDEFIHNMKVLLSKHHNEWNDTIGKFETKFHQEREFRRRNPPDEK